MSIKLTWNKMESVKKKKSSYSPMIGSSSLRYSRYCNMSSNNGMVCTLTPSPEKHKHS